MVCTGWVGCQFAWRQPVALSIFRSVDFVRRHILRKSRQARLEGGKDGAQFRIEQIDYGYYYPLTFPPYVVRWRWPFFGVFSTLHVLRFFCKQEEEVVCTLYWYCAVLYFLSLRAIIKSMELKHKQ
jgi:hypothetical protein